MNLKYLFGLIAVVAIAVFYVYYQPSSPPPTELASTSTPTSTTPAATPPAPCLRPATPASLAGPYYKDDSPERNSLLEAGTIGDRLTVTGIVFDSNCQPIPGARLDFWQTNADGKYDNVGFKLRGHQFTDDAGRYQLTTIVPGNYIPRPAHIHVKVAAPANGPTLTSQLYFPGQLANKIDPIFNAAQVVDIKETKDGLTGTYDFVLP